MTVKRTFALSLRESAGLLGLFLNPSKRRASAVYDLLASHNNLAESSLYLNLGYWAAACTYDDACEALARELGEAANFGPSDEILDAGFGFGDQDRYWMQTYRPRRIVGINVTTSQVEVARRRHAVKGLEFYYASATDMPFENASFDKVVALESAFHFDSRERFMQEAFRVLRPGGTLAVADVLPIARPRGLFAKLGEYLGRSFWQIPRSNMYDSDVFARKLRGAGFVDTHIRSIGDDVFAPFKAFARRRVEDPDVKARVHPWLRSMWSAPHAGFRKYDYVIATARKPAA